ncbi:conserved hypothetical protein [Gloeothece citriformis PCC 7424]|uniref:PHA accumulation regulator DNA-binding-like protein n=1 Tax=Gloeothece citriformis (strain PCC 7424) TaxID=65393 RepID=B7KDJ3_GLOC7|nr:hypothetical protein [Gloeothece citriformis]ACK70295.1 conserved hypothetical protein [Gloeothece citriformis PCC 7424]
MKKLLLLKNTQSGMTLVESLVITMILGFLATLAVPNFLNFLKQQQLNKANEDLELRIRQVQNLAQRENVAYTLEFQEEGGEFEYRAYKNGETPDDDDWKLALDKPLDNITLHLDYGTKILFNHDGTINTDGDDDETIKVNEKIALSLENLNPPPKRCVVIKTLLGVIEAQKNDYCN